jgi:uncharacterized membrane protein
MKKGFLFRTSLLLFIGVVAIPSFAHAQTKQQIQDTDQLARARVITAVSEGSALIPGTNVTSTKQTLTVEVLDGSDKGKSVTFENDYTQLSVADPYRLPVLFALALIFVVLLFLFGGIQGIRGLISLLGSLVIIFYLLLPNIYAGHSPILVSLGIASLIIITGSYITHGISRTTTSAMIGMLGTVIITGAATYFVIHIGHFSGFTTETNAYLNFDTNGRISMVGLLFASIMIGLLGVLYDIAIGQAVAVEELYLAGTYTRAQVYTRAMRIGREHIGALVNTLAIAYVGTALPLILLFKETTADIGFIINSELFATEIVRILMGSIGLVLAVPITTAIATYMLHRIHRPSGFQ